VSSEKLNLLVKNSNYKAHKGRRLTDLKEMEVIYFSQSSGILLLSGFCDLCALCGKKKNFLLFFLNQLSFLRSFLCGY